MIICASTQLIKGYFTGADGIPNSVSKLCESSDARYGRHRLHRSTQGCRRLAQEFRPSRCFLDFANSGRRARYSSYQLSPPRSRIPHVDLRQAEAALRLVPRNSTRSNQRMGSTSEFSFGGVSLERSVCRSCTHEWTGRLSSSETSASGRDSSRFDFVDGILFEDYGRDCGVSGGDG